jgi:hypothetical protein
MRRALPALTAGILGAAVLVLAGPASALTPPDPTLVSSTLAPNPAVFTEDSGITVRGKLTLDEAESWPDLVNVRVFDPACPPAFLDEDLGDAFGDGCAQWVSSWTAERTTTTNIVTLKAEWPRRDMNDNFVESPTLSVVLTYANPGESPKQIYVDPDLQVYGASSVSFDPPGVVQPGDSFTGSSKAEHVTDDWNPVEGDEVTLQHLAANDTWEDQDTGTTDAQGDVDLTSSAVTEAGDWRVQLTDFDTGRLTFSAVRHVSLPAPPPVVTPAPTPTPTPPPPPTATPVPQPPTVSATHPSAPRRQHATSASGRATLYWASPASTGGAAIDRYQIRRGTSSFVRNLGPTARRFTFTRLRNGSFYRLYVRAHNAKGFSGWVAAGARPHAPPAPRDYAGCARLHRVYPHGVGRPGAVDRGGHVTDFTRSLATYRLNTEDDRDHDGIACER